MDSNPGTVAPQGFSTTPEPRLEWLVPTVVDLGTMGELTLQLGGSGGGTCDPSVDPSCGF